MTRIDTVTELVAHAASRAIQPAKFVRLARAFVDEHALDAEAAAHLLAHALLSRVTHEARAPPALLVNYLFHLILADLVHSVVAITHLLYALPIPPATLSTLSTVLVQPPSLPALPPTLDVPELPDYPSRSTPALILFLPLLRACVAPASPSPSTLFLAARIAAALPPSPPLDAGVETAQLLHDLPEDIAQPLRVNLSDLLGNGPPQPLFLHDLASSSSRLQPFAPVSVGLPDLAVNLQAQPARPVSGPLQVPLASALPFVLAAFDRVAWITASTAATIVRFGTSLTSDSKAFTEALVVASLNASRLVLARGCLFAAVTLPELLTSWRSDGARFEFPDGVQDVLAKALAATTAEAEQADAAWNAKYQAASQITDDEGNAFAEPDGWSILSTRESFVRQCVSHGLVGEDALVHLVPTFSESSGTGESLADRVAHCPAVHLAALAAFVMRAFGAASAFANEVSQMLSAASDLPPSEGLLRNIAASPELLATLTLHTTPTLLLDTLVARLLDRPVDRAAWFDDPQGYLIRHGAGVILVEAVCAEFDLPLPQMLEDARLPHDLRDLDAGEQELVNSWVKALYGSDGIDDQILLATSPHVFSRLATTLIDQSIAAAANGVIDMDTLRSGLSYFSQPLISWSLGGIVGWLCGEVERKGLLAGLHLVVLQCLLLDPSFPDPLLRVHAVELSRIVDSTYGHDLQSVFQTSSFDVAAVKERLVGVGALHEPAPRTDSPQPQEIRDILQLLRTVGVSVLDWEPILARLARATWPDPTRLVDIVLSDILFSLDAPVDVLALIPLLPLAPPSRARLAHVLVATSIPSLFEPRSLITHSALTPNGSALDRFVRSVLVGSGDADVGLALEAALRLVREGRKTTGETALTDTQRRLWDGLHFFSAKQEAGGHLEDDEQSTGAAYINQLVEQLGLVKPVAETPSERLALDDLLAVLAGAMESRWDATFLERFAIATFLALQFQSGWHLLDLIKADETSKFAGLRLSNLVVQVCGEIKALLLSPPSRFGVALDWQDAYIAGRDTHAVFEAEKLRDQALLTILGVTGRTALASTTTKRKAAQIDDGDIQRRDRKHCRLSTTTRDEENQGGVIAQPMLSAGPSRTPVVKMDGQSSAGLSRVKLEDITIEQTNTKGKDTVDSQPVDLKPADAMPDVKAEVISLKGDGAKKKKRSTASGVKLEAMVKTERE
ncbi:hypothetical protein Q5752_004377 [Cryptotrichosporon argae]